ncbi:MAG: hypothetical protein HOM25_18025 [Rhodospirillaceae bacterium]|jgi:hypothetical protein|nr:hypothetical protein [Rhodospirillaceae bacterium]MBT5664894.1 hypothetical protein [Rhodospirillaceae bacterium]MBT5810331.1 hypothetical protein [Rhodospirillaceae bacterium]
MDQINEFVDERQKSWCIHCGEFIESVDSNRDHAPSKILLLKPYPENLPVVQICKQCNEGFSLDEEYTATFLSCVLTGSTNPDTQCNPRAALILRKSPNLRARIERAKKEYQTLGGETRTVWIPETGRINRIALKNARNHAFFEYGEPMLQEPNSIWSAPLETLTTEQRSEFEKINMEADLAGWPEVGSRMMTRLLTGQDFSDGWIVIQDGTYQYGVVQHDGILVRSVLFNYLATEVYWAD